jgi:amino acid permease
MSLEQSFRQVSEVLKLRNDKRDEWLKNVLICATTLIGILISLHKEKSSSLLEHYLFCSTIGIISLGILSGSMCLFANVNALHRFVQKRTKELLSE